MNMSSLKERSLSLLLSFLMHCGLLFSQTSSDSLSLNLLETEIQKAEIAVQQTDLLHRMMPQMHLSASYGIRDIVFYDPSANSPYFIPRDAYRLTLSLSITDLLDGSKHDLALNQRERLRIEYQLGLRKIAESRSARTRKAGLLDAERELLEEELRILEKIEEYTQMLFEKGKVEYDALARCRLQIINVKKNLVRLEREAP